ncbi:MAG: hypothetical protein ACMG6E_07055 [Candidatus Roizmanbacteria bacterium]
MHSKILVEAFDREMSSSVKICNLSHEEATVILFALRYCYGMSKPDRFLLKEYTAEHLLKIYEIMK